jgi:hypothetical protein
MTSAAGVHVIFATGRPFSIHQAAKARQALSRTPAERRRFVCAAIQAMSGTGWLVSGRSAYRGQLAGLRGALRRVVSSAWLNDCNGSKETIGRRFNQMSHNIRMHLTEYLPQ